MSAGSSALMVSWFWQQMFAHVEYWSCMTLKNFCIWKPCFVIRPVINDVASLKRYVMSRGLVQDVASVGTRTPARGLLAWSQIVESLAARLSLWVPRGQTGNPAGDWRSSLAGRRPSKTTTCVLLQWNSEAQNCSKSRFATSGHKPWSDIRY